MSGSRLGDDYHGGKRGTHVEAGRPRSSQRPGLRVWIWRSDVVSWWRNRACRQAQDTHTTHTHTISVSLSSSAQPHLSFLPPSPPPTTPPLKLTPLRRLRTAGCVAAAVSCFLQSTATAAGERWTTGPQSLCDTQALSGPRSAAARSRAGSFVACAADGASGPASSPGNSRATAAPERTSGMAWLSAANKTRRAPCCICRNTTRASNWHAVCVSLLYVCEKMKNEVGGLART